MNDGSLPALVKSIYYNSVTFIVVSRCYRHFFGIGILPVSDLLGGQNFGRYQNFGENHFFPRKGGRAPQKGGQCPPFEEKKGSTAPLILIETKFSFGVPMVCISMVNTKQHRPIPTGKYQFDVQI